MMRRNSAVLILLMTFGWLVSCDLLETDTLDSRYGPEDPSRFDNPVPGGRVDFWSQVNPVLEKRCVVCHACYDAPCQLKLSAFEGLTRGASKNLVYHGTRILADAPTRLFIDANSVSEWREKDFFPILNERANSPEANIEGSVLAQQLLLKQENPLPDVRLLPDSFDFRLNREQACPAIDEYPDYRSSNPLWGMPYGLPGLEESETELLLDWIADGAPFNERNRVTPQLQSRLQDWEEYFNGDTLKARLVNRYLYEHLFLANLYFEDEEEPVFFNLVRSSTPPGQPIRIINTALPISDPGVDRVYYRLMPVRESISVKNNLPFRLDAERRRFWDALFYETDYTVSSLPSYDLEVASNPFLTFKDIPSRSRYRFLLDEAEFTIMGFIKGPVCRGQTALNVINDYFWVSFVDPDLLFQDTGALNAHLESMRLPAEAGRNALPVNWISYARDERDYLAAKHAYTQELFQRVAPDLNLIWDGDGVNDNAALTVFRHFDSASVVKGLLGDRPQTAWVINYPLFERIHYLLVAGFDVFGNVSHQLNSRIYMDFLRMEGEFNFLALLPDQARQRTWSTWYRGGVNPVTEFMAAQLQLQNDTSVLEYASDDPAAELYRGLKQHLAPIASDQHALEHGFDGQEEQELLQQLAGVKGLPASILPQTVFIELVDQDSGTTHYYTLLSNSVYTNISHLFNNEDRRLPLEDTVTLAYGFIGAYPEVLMRVNLEQLPEFVELVQGLDSEDRYAELLDNFGVRRTDRRFWSTADAMHEAFLSRNPVTGGLFDFNRLENR